MAWTKPPVPQGTSFARPEPLADRRVSTGEAGVTTDDTLTEILALTPAAGQGTIRLTKVEVAVQTEAHFIQVEVDGNIVAFGIAAADSVFVDWFPFGSATSFTADGNRKVSVKAKTLTGAGLAFAVILGQ